MYVMIRVGQVGTVVGTHQGVNDNITMFPWSMFLFFYFLFFQKETVGGSVLSWCCAVLCCAVLCCAMMTDLSGRLDCRLSVCRLSDCRLFVGRGGVLLIDSMISSHPLSYIYSSSTNMFVLFE